jgi:PAS domain S-box-containing protein
VAHYQQTSAPIQAALQESEQRFRTVWQSAHDAMALAAPDGTVTAANPAYYALYGYSPEEVLGKNFVVICASEERASA